MSDSILQRRGPLDGAAPIDLPGLTVRAAPPVVRHKLYGASPMDLPRDPCRARDLAGGTALWLGPEEWLLLGAADFQADSVVDVSHAFAGLDVTGALAADTLNAGCPLDLDLAAFPVGMCTRTILGKAEIILWRRDAEWFRIEIARSFAAYVLAFLRESATG